MDKKKPDFEAYNASTDSNDGNGKIPPDVGDSRLKRLVPIPTPVNAYKITAHACTWRFNLEGVPKRTPYKTIQMRGWTARYWNFQGCKVQACKKTLFIHVKTRKKPTTRQAIYGAWNRVDRARRAFSLWQQVGLIPDETNRPTGAQNAHIVIETPTLTNPLNTQAFKPESARIGLICDASHGFKPEFTGAESIEGGLGADWVFLKMPEEFQELKAALQLIEGENRATAQALARFIEAWKK